MEEKNNRLIQKYNYSSDSTFVLFDLKAGNYIVQIIEDGLSKDLNIQIEEPAKLQANQIIVEKYPSGEELCDGTIEIKPTGGTEPYSYNWIEGAIGKNSARLTGLCENIYTCEVRDNNSCEMVKATSYLFRGFKKNEN
jgi:hypothetical protein